MTRDCPLCKQPLLTAEELEEREQALAQVRGETEPGGVLSRMVREQDAADTFSATMALFAKEEKR